APTALSDHLRECVVLLESVGSRILICPDLCYDTRQEDDRFQKEVGAGPGDHLDGQVGRNLTQVAAWSGVPSKPRPTSAASDASISSSTSTAANSCRHAFDPR